MGRCLSMWWLKTSFIFSNFLIVDIWLSYREWVIEAHSITYHRIEYFEYIHYLIGILAIYSFINLIRKETMSKLLDVVKELHNSNPYPNGQKLMLLIALEKAFRYDEERWNAVVGRVAHKILEDCNFKYKDYSQLHFIHEGYGGGMYPGHMVSELAVRAIVRLAYQTDPSIIRVKEFYDKLDKDKNESISSMLMDFKMAFDAAGKVNDKKVTVWTGRALCKLLGYQTDNWSNFHDVIQKTVAEATAFDRLYPGDIVETVHTYTGAAGPQTTIDYELSLNGCSLVAARANDNKIEVKMARKIIREMLDMRHGGFVSTEGVEFNIDFMANAKKVNGKYWWDAKWLQKALGYANWQNFNNNVILKVKVKYANEVAQHAGGASIDEALNDLCARISRSPKANIININTPFESGNNTVKYKPDYLMDAQFCYLVAMEASASKELVRKAKVLFAQLLEKAWLEEVETISNRFNGLLVN